MERRGEVQVLGWTITIKREEEEKFQFEPPLRTASVLLTVLVLGDQ